MKSCVLWLYVLFAAPQLAQGSEFGLRRQVWPEDRKRTVVAMVDVDNDGLVDLVTWSRTPNLVIHRGLPGGRWGERLLELSNSGATTVSSARNAFAFLDVEGDGDQDLVVSYLSTCGQGVCACTFQECQLMLNDGSGGFVDATGQLPVVSNPFRILQAGDVDADGDVDLVGFGISVTYSSFGGNTQYCNTPDALWLNDGLGNFTSVGDPAPQTGTWPPDASVVNATLVDLDGDGASELLVATKANGIQYLSNDGSGGFTWTPIRLSESSATTPVQEMTAFDADSDGDLDLFVTRQFQSSGPGASPGPELYVNDGTGALSPAALPSGLFGEAHAIGDWDLDGDFDVALFGRMTLFVGIAAQLENDGLGGFTQVSSLPSPRIRSTAAIGAFAADIDGDGDEDAVASQVEGENEQYRSNAAGSLGWVGGQPELEAHILANYVEDFDGDGWLDVVTTGDLPSILEGDGTGQFRSRPAGTWGVGGRAYSFGIADFNGDGLRDLASVRYSSTGTPQAVVDFRTGASFGSRVDVGPPSGGFLIAAGDVDGDGDHDVALLDWPPTTLKVHENDGLGVFTPAPGGAQTLAGGSAFPGAAQMVDMTGDGVADLATLRRIYENVGGSFIPVGGEYPATSQWARGMDLGDVDLDGDVDVLVGTIDNLDNLTRPPNLLLLNDGTGNLSSSAGLQQGNVNTTVVDLGDYDEDGDLDTAWTDRSFGDGSTLRWNDGFGAFQIGAYPLPPEVELDLPVYGDFDVDGDIDLLCAGRTPFVLFDLRKQYNRATLPSVGKTLELQLNGPALSSYVSAWSPGEVAVFLPAFAGTLRLDPARLFIVDIGALDAFGQALIDAPIPASASLTGMTVLTQAALFQPLSLTNFERLRITDL